MDYVVCDEVSDGFRASDRTVGIKSLQGKREYLRLSLSSLLQKDGKVYLAIGVVRHDLPTNSYLIEFPHEADSGANRIWVPASSMLLETPHGMSA
jgi:hypothetical protein